MNQGQDFCLLLDQGLGLRPKGLLSFWASFCSLLASSSWSLFKNTLFASSPKLEIGVSGPFPSFCNFLLMSGAAWIIKEWDNRTLASILFRSAWVKFLKVSVSLPQKRAGFSFSPCVTTFILTIFWTPQVIPYSRQVVRYLKDFFPTLVLGSQSSSLEGISSSAEARLTSTYCLSSVTFLAWSRIPAFSSSLQHWVRMTSISRWGRS